MAEKFKKGQKVRIKAGMYRPRDGSANPGTYLMRGQEYKLTEDDMQRSDLDLIFEVPGEDETVPERAEESEYDVEDTAFNYNDVTYDALAAQLDSMNADQARQFLSGDQWSHDGMLVAQQAEKDGKDRKSVNDLIADRLLDLEEDEDGGPEG